MRLYLLLTLFVISYLPLSAQCFDYQSELQNAESYISTAIKNLKKAEKAETLEKAQQFIDKAVSQAEFAETSANLAKEYAANCNCNKGKVSATNIYNAAFDCRTQAHQAADCETLNDLKELVGKSLNAAESTKELISDGASYCLATD